MTFLTTDWQAVTVALIVIAALLYTVRRALSRLRSFASGGRGVASDCATGCGKCGDDVGTAKPREVLVQIEHGKSPRKTLR